MIDSARFTAIDIASEADTETLERYGQNIDNYIEKNYTYIPMPEDGKYYDRDEGLLKGIENEQWIEEGDKLITVLKKLQTYPFLLIERHKERYFFPPFDKEDDSDKEDPPEDGNGTNDDVPSFTMHFGFTGDVPDDVKEGFFDGEGFEDKMSAKEYFNQHPEKANEELGSLYSIITLTDLNRRTVRQIAYPTLAELADLLSQQIQSEFPDSRILYPELRPATIGNWQKNRERGMDVHISEYMNLSEMKQVISSSEGHFVEECGFSSRTKCREKLGSVNELRKKIMHANRTLVHNHDDLEKVLKRIETAQEVVENIKKPDR